MYPISLGHRTYLFNLSVVIVILVIVFLANEEHFGLLFAKEIQIVVSARALPRTQGRPVSKDKTTGRLDLFEVRQLPGAEDRVRLTDAGHKSSLLVVVVAAVDGGDNLGPPWRLGVRFA